MRAVIRLCPCPGTDFNADSNALYLWIAEIFAPASECFYSAGVSTEKKSPENPGVTLRDLIVIVCAKPGLLLESVKSSTPLAGCSD